VSGSRGPFLVPSSHTTGSAGRHPAVHGAPRKALVLGEQAQEAQLPEHGSGHGRVHMTRPGIPLRSATVEGECPRASLVEAMPAEFTVSGPGPLPLAPHDATQFPAKPLIRVLEARLHVCQPEVHHPPSGYEVEVRHEVSEAAASPCAQRASVDTQTD
jgi:hypothetical protein